MPSTTSEYQIGRSRGWWVLLGNAAIVLILAGLIPMAMSELGPSVHLLAYVSFVLACGVGLWYFAELLVVRPRRSVQDLREASSHGSGQLVVRGSSRTAAVATFAVATWTMTALLSALRTTRGWGIVFIIVAVLLAIVVVDQGLAACQRRYLILTADGVEAGSFGGSSRLTWDDIGSIDWVDGLGGHRVFRIVPRPGDGTWQRLSRHPLHRSPPRCDVEPLALGLDPVLLGVTLLAALEDPHWRQEISILTTSSYLVEPEWTVMPTLSQGAALLLRVFRPEKMSN